MVRGPIAAAGLSFGAVLAIAAVVAVRLCAVVGAPQPGNVTVAECAATCRRWGWSCLGFSYFARPSWSSVSECYIKKVCTLGRVHTLAGALTFQVDDTGRCPAPDWEQHLAKVAGGFSYAEVADEGVR